MGILSPSFSRTFLCTACVVVLFVESKERRNRLSNNYKKRKNDSKMKIKLLKTIKLDHQFSLAKTSLKKGTIIKATFPEYTTPAMKSHAHIFQMTDFPVVGALKMEATVSPASFQIVK